MTLETRVTRALEIEHPVVQAPMAGGPTTPKLVAAVSNAGGLGSLGAAYLPPETLREQVREIRRRTEAPFNVNLFVPSPFEADPERLEVLNSVAVRDPILERTGMALLEELVLGGPADRLYAESLAQVLAVRLLRHHSSLGRGPSRSLHPDRTGRLSEPVLRSVIDYVGDNLSRDLSLAEIAAAANLSPYHFARAFKRSTGLSPHQYVLHRRVERAKDLLKGTDLPVGVVALRVGFASPSHFSQQFKRIVGTPPSAFR